MFVIGKCLRQNLIPGTHQGGNKTLNAHWVNNFSFKVNMMDKIAVCFVAAFLTRVSPFT